MWAEAELRANQVTTADVTPYSDLSKDQNGCVWNRVPLSCRLAIALSMACHGKVLWPYLSATLMCCLQAPPLTSAVVVLVDWSQPVQCVVPGPLVANQCVYLVITPIWTKMSPTTDLLNDPLADNFRGPGQWVWPLQQNSVSCSITVGTILNPSFPKQIFFNMKNCDFFK